MRGNGFLYGAGLYKVGYVSDALVHVADLPFSLLSLAANPLGTHPGSKKWREWRAHSALAARLADEPPFSLGDGVDNWAALATRSPSARTELLHEAHGSGWNADDGHGQALRVGRYKLILEKGPMWHGPPNDLWYESGSNPSKYTHTLTCGGPPPAANASDYCHPEKLPCLFDVLSDPQAPGEPNWRPPPACCCPARPSRHARASSDGCRCEYRDLSRALPEVLANLTASLAAYQATAVPVSFHHLNGTNCTSPTPPTGGTWMPFCA